MRVIVLNSQVPFVRGGAEIHAENLVTALSAAGHETALVQVPFRWYPPEKMLDHLLACRLLDVSDSNGVRVERVIGLRFPAYHIPHPQKVMWILHQQRPLFDLWNTDEADLAYYPHGRDIRESLVTLERQLLHEARALFANSSNVADRLAKFSGHQARPLYHPPHGADQFFTREAESFLFYPSRLCGLKRQDLVLRALAKTKEAVTVHFAGRPDHPDYAHELAQLAKSLGVSDRVKWLGGVTEEAKLDAYARCLGVVFPPIDEDYGYITLEAMLSRKPVITCRDSGGPLEFVEDAKTGLIANPTPESLGAAMDRLWQDRRGAREMGEAGRDHYVGLNITWENVVSTLLAD